MKVYLCGGINNLSDADCKNWRQEAKGLLKNFDVLDPMDRDFRGQETQNVKHIVESDLKDINDCDILLAKVDKPSWGTAMEIFYAFNNNKKVYMFGVGDSCSPWLSHHSHFRAPSLEQCVNLIRWQNLIGRT